MLVVRVDVVVLQLLGLLEEQDGEQEQHVATDQLEEEQLVGSAPEPTYVAGQN